MKARTWQWGMVGLLIITLKGYAGPPQLAAQDWTHYVRIGGYGLSLDRVDNIVNSATASHVFGIETDNDIPGRYESFLDPTEKLRAIQAVAEKAHAVGNYAFVYIAGLECITDHAASRPHTFFKDHPDWVQRKINGEPAVFGGGTAFWIRAGDEDVWISPYASAWRKIYMERVRQIAATGIDGVYVDIPYWMTHFKGWEKSWASFDDYTLAAFKGRTGLDARRDVKLGDYNDPGFRQWIDFRIQTLTEFMKEIDTNIKAVNPRCVTIAEIYPGIEEGAARVGTDVYELYPVVDAIAHEYEYGHGDHMAASRAPLDWFGYLTGMFSFRSFAGPKATWMLNYSWDGERRVGPKEPMKNLFMCEVMAGTNVWDTPGHVMAGSNDLPTRTEVFGWIAQHDKTFYLPREPVHPFGVYFSPSTRNYFPEEFIAAYRGLMILLMQSHLEFQVVTPRNLSSFTGDLLALPDVRCLSHMELEQLQRFVAAGKTLMFTAETGKYDERRQPYPENPVQKLLTTAHAAQPEASTSSQRMVYLSTDPGSAYLHSLEQQFNAAATEENYASAGFEKLRSTTVQGILETTTFQPAVDVQASPFVASQIAKVDGKLCVFLANFKGLKSGEVAEQTPEKNVKVAFPASQGARGYVLPFLGKVAELHGEWSGGKLTCIIPEIDKGAVVWVEDVPPARQHTPAGPNR